MSESDTQPSLFELVPSQNISAALVDGIWEVRVSHLLPRATDRVLRMNFAAGRIGPHGLSVVGAKRVFRVRETRDRDRPDLVDGIVWTPRAGIHTWDALLPGEVTSTVLRWAEPAQGAYLLRLGEAREAIEDTHTPKLLEELWITDGSHANFPTFKQAVAEIDADKSRDDNQKRASRFWLSLDLTTSLENPKTEGPAIADHLGIDRALVAVDPLRRKWLTDLLQQRWMTRTTCAAAGVSFARIHPEFKGDAYRLSCDVARLFLALAEREFPAGIASAAPHLVSFACGALRRPFVGDRLNIEPNSIYMASFAEVIDLAGLDKSEMQPADVAELETMRRMFVAMLKPFLDIYALRMRRGKSRHASDYLYENLDARIGPQARGDWTKDRLSKHYAMLMALTPEAFATYWGEVLVFGLSDETWVKEAQAQAGGDGPASSTGADAAGLRRPLSEARTKRPPRDDAEDRAGN